MVDYVNGKESEWNEASFKAKRLNEIQELINYFKMNPMGVTNGRFNYYWLLKSIESLYGEGQSKYKQTEKNDCYDLMEMANKMIKFMSPHIQIKINSISGNKVSFTFNQKNYDALTDILYELEMLVKDYNDAHGLTTKNKGTSGLF